MRVVVLMVAAVLATASCGQSLTPVREHPGDWHRVEGVPLSPREGAVGAWTGEEVLLVGGSDARPCPPNARCIPPKEPLLSDGAAYRPATGKWRRLSDAPIGFNFAESVVLGETLYFWVTGLRGQPKSPGVLLAYHIKQNSWQELPLPPDRARHEYQIARAGDRILLYNRSDNERGERADWVYNPALRIWSELPADPLSPSSSRTMVWTGDRLVLLDHKLTRNSDSDRPQFIRAAVLDIAAGSWHRLPDSELLGIGYWFPVNGRLINPSLGSEDGGEVNNWGHTYPNGGILDLDSGEWSELPDPPADFAPSGLLTPSGGHFISERGWLLDTTTYRWIRIPELNEPDGRVQSRTVVSAGRELFVFGGARFSNTEYGGKLINEAWSWSPPD